MGCSKTRQSASLLPIIDGGFRAPRNRRTVKPKSVRPVQDFHCPVCGEMRANYPNFRHICPGEKPIGYQESRRAICGECPHARDGVCLPLLTIHPEKPCLIEIGVAMPAVECPLKKWPRVLWACGKCGSVSFRGDGLRECPICRPPRRDPNR